MMGNIAEEEVNCLTVQDHDKVICAYFRCYVKGKLAISYSCSIAKTLSPSSFTVFLCDAKSHIKCWVKLQPIAE